MKKDADEIPYIVLGLILLVVITNWSLKIIAYFERPFSVQNLANQFINFISVLGLCIGSGILFIVVIFGCVWLNEKISTKLNNRIKRLSEDYRVRCYVIKMKQHQYEPMPDDLPEEDNQDNKEPIYFNVTVINHGVCITALSETDREEKGDLNKSYPYDFFNRDWTNPIIIPSSYIKLYYLMYENRNNSMILEHPLRKAGFKGELPTLKDQQGLEVVIVFKRYQEKRKMPVVESLELPLKLILIVLNKEHNYDTAATSKLYTTLYQQIISIPPDDDAWMYRSRPSFLNW